MINRILHKLGEASRAEWARLMDEWGITNDDHTRWDEAEIKAENVRVQRLDDIKEDYRISLNNTRYLRSHISATTSSLVHRTTRTSKINAMKQIAWFETKLAEELNNVEFFSKQINKYYTNELKTL